MILLCSLTDPSSPSPTVSNSLVPIFQMQATNHPNAGKPSLSPELFRSSAKNRRRGFPLAALCDSEGEKFSFF